MNQYYSVESDISRAPRAPFPMRQFAPTHFHDGAAHGAHADNAKSDHSAIFIFDAQGRTQYCSSPEKFASDESALLGMPIRRLVPGLPLRENTPGYNIAYVRFAFGEDQWQQHMIRTTDELLRPMHICLKPIPLDRGYCLVGLVRPKEFVDSPSAVSRDVEPSPNHHGDPFLPWKYGHEAIARYTNPGDFLPTDMIRQSA